MDGGVRNEYLLSSRTIWYELHAREWPYKNQPAEVIIWQVGSGMRPNLTQIGMGKEISVSRMRGEYANTFNWGANDFLKYFVSLQMKSYCNVHIYN